MILDFCVIKSKKNHGCFWLSILTNTRGYNLKSIFKTSNPRFEDLIAASFVDTWKNTKGQSRCLVCAFRATVEVFSLQYGGLCGRGPAMIMNLKGFFYYARIKICLRQL